MSFVGSEIPRSVIIEERDCGSRTMAAVQETIGEVKMLRDEALQAQADAERKLARCEKQLREATDQLRSAQEVGVWQATWLEATIMAWLQPFLCRNLQQ